MKIVHFISSVTYGGIEQHVHELSLDQQVNNEVIIICTHTIKPFFEKDFNVYALKNFSRNNIFYILKLLLVLRKINADIVHTHGSKTTSIFIKLRQFINVSHVATLHNIKKNMAPYNKSKYVIAVSNQITKGLDTKYSVISNWINFNHENISESIKQEDHAIAVGRLEKAKGFDLLIKSWINVKRDLYIYGDGSQIQYLRKLIKKLNLDDKIFIKDPLTHKEILKEYIKAKVLIISSRNEGGPRVALVALALGTPVLSTNVGHMNSIFPKEFLAEPDNEDSLRSFLEQYVDSIDDINQQSIYKYVREEFNLQSQSKKIMSIYNEING